MLARLDATLLRCTRASISPSNWPVSTWSPTLTWSFWSCPDTCAPTGTVLLGCKSAGGCHGGLDIRTRDRGHERPVGLDLEGGSVPVVATPGRGGEHDQSRKTALAAPPGRRCGRSHLGLSRFGGHQISGSEDHWAGLEESARSAK